MNSNRRLLSSRTKRLHSNKNLHQLRARLRPPGCLHEIEYDIHVSWERELHRDPIRARIAKVDSRISFQHLAACDCWYSASCSESSVRS